MQRHRIAYLNATVRKGRITSLHIKRTTRGLIRTSILAAIAGTYARPTIRGVQLTATASCLMVPTHGSVPIAESDTGKVQDDSPTQFDCTHAVASSAQAPTEKLLFPFGPPVQSPLGVPYDANNTWSTLEPSPPQSRSMLCPPFFSSNCLSQVVRLVGDDVFDRKYLLNSDRIEVASWE